MTDLSHIRNFATIAREQLVEAEIELVAKKIAAFVDKQVGGMRRA